MGYASQLARSYSNPESVWNSLGAVGSTSAWDRSSADLAAFEGILSAAKLGRKSGTSGTDRYKPAGPPAYGSFGGSAFETAQALSPDNPNNPLLPQNIAEKLGKYQEMVMAGKYMKPLRVSDLF
jgi:hypothetical protein